MHIAKKQPTKKSKVTSHVYLPSAAASRGFTLVELLVTVSIIAILLGMIVPVFSHMREKAKIAAAKAGAKNLETAFRAYLDHYKTWKFNATGNEQPIEGELVRVLRGDNVGDANPDRIAFFEFPNTNAGDRAVDPWYDPNEPDNERVYRVTFDHDYDNKVQKGGETIYRPVIVWSLGPPSASNQIITSW